MTSAAPQAQLDRDASRDNKLVAHLRGELCLTESEALLAYREVTGRYIKPRRFSELWAKVYAHSAIEHEFGRYPLTYRDDTGETATARALTLQLGGA